MSNPNVAQADEAVEPDYGQGIAIISDDPIGMRLTNQSGGYACKHPEITGTWIKDESRKAQIVAEILSDYFTGTKYGGWCCDGIDGETAIFITQLLRNILDLKLTVDIDMCKQSMEAWIYCVDDKNNQHVLIWGNSD